jgi:hypothetical protein
MCTSEGPRLVQKKFKKRDRPARVNVAVLTPIIRPKESSSGPPEFPAWIKEKGLGSRKCLVRDILSSP